MAMRLSALQVNGEMLDIEVTAEMTGRDLKQQIKEIQHSDEVTRMTTGVEIVVGDLLLNNDEQVAKAGCTADLVVNVVFKTNLVRCSKKQDVASLGSHIDPDLVLAVEIPEGDNQISERAFAACERLAKLTVPNSVTRIGSYAFAHCSSLASLTLPNSVTHIGNYAFCNCSALTSLTLPNSVTHIGDCAFQDCSSLANLTISDSVTHIGDLAFEGCSSLDN